MMGMQQSPQSSLFYIGINIDRRVRANHPLRRVKQLIDFDFSYKEVKDRYGTNGNVSVPPPIILKLMLLHWGHPSLTLDLFFDGNRDPEMNV